MKEIENLLDEVGARLIKIHKETDEPMEHVLCDWFGLNLKQMDKVMEAMSPVFAPIWRQGVEAIRTRSLDSMKEVLDMAVEAVGDDDGEFEALLKLIQEMERD